MKIKSEYLGSPTGFYIAFIFYIISVIVIYNM